jgi:hypothetical protein
LRVIEAWRDHRRSGAAVLHAARRTDEFVDGAALLPS